MTRSTHGRPISTGSIRLLATDYDGTLATSGVVAAATWTAIERWKGAGRRVVLVTGREVDDLATVCPRLDLFDRVVAENGGWLGDPASGAGRPLAARPPDRFVEALRARGVGPISVGRVVVGTWEPHASTIEAVIREFGLPLRVIANKRALMILPAGIDKASGLRAALEELGAGAEGVVGVGDAENDEPLLAAAGLGVAVANALPSLRDRADFVTRGERGAGVVELIDALLAGATLGEGGSNGHAIRFPPPLRQTSGRRRGVVGSSDRTEGARRTGVEEISPMSLSTIEPGHRQGADRAAGPWPRSVTHDLSYLRTVLVNVFFSGLPGAGDRDWVLIDAGIPGQAGAIIAAAARQFQPGARPSAIILTHGHFDHVGALLKLAELWDVPVFAHELELPYLTGQSPYPPPDPTVGGGLLALSSWLFPRGPINLGDRVHPLPADGSVPFMPGWRWIPTPGHTTGHVSLWRDSDRTLIAGDAFVTTKQESALAVIEQRQEIHGPPAYYTSDWGAARKSVEALSALNPEIAATGHGVPMTGEALRAGLRALLRDFDTVAYPEHGRYAHQPALADARGVISVPPEKPGVSPKLAICVAGGVLAGLILGRLMGRRR